MNGSENINHALVPVRNSEMIAYKASKLYEVPYQTLSDKLKNIHINRFGHTTVFTKVEESLIVKWIHHRAKIEFPLTKEQFPFHPFKDGIPGRHWYRVFQK